MVVIQINERITSMKREPKQGIVSRYLSDKTGMIYPMQQEAGHLSLCILRQFIQYLGKQLDSAIFDTAHAQLPPIDMTPPIR